MNTEQSYPNQGSAPNTNTLQDTWSDEIEFDIRPDKKFGGISEAHITYEALSGRVRSLVRENIQSLRYYEERKASISLRDQRDLSKMLHELAFLNSMMDRFVYSISKHLETLHDKVGGASVPSSDDSMQKQ